MRAEESWMMNKMVVLKQKRMMITIREAKTKKKAMKARARVRRILRERKVKKVRERKTENTSEIKTTMKMKRTKALSMKMKANVKTKMTVSMKSTLVHDMRAAPMSAMIHLTMMGRKHNNPPI